METSMMKLSRVGHKQMMTEKRGIQNANLVKRVCILDDDIVSSAWKHAAVLKTAAKLRIAAKITDEKGTHLELFINMWHTLRVERPELFTDKLIDECIRLIDLGVKHEIVWGKYIISEGVLGLTNTIVENFIKSLADTHMVRMGLGKQYNVENPVPWFDEAASIDGTDENSFETKITAYQTGALEW